jgi:hypothetical protein
MPSFLPERVRDLIGNQFLDLRIMHCTTHAYVSRDRHAAPRGDTICIGLPAFFNTIGWEREYTDFGQCDLSGREHVYVWVHGVYFNIRLDDDWLYTLAMIGVRPDGQKELLAAEDGTAIAPRVGKQCYASTSGAAGSPQCSPSLMVRSASGAALVEAGGLVRCRWSVPV